MNKIKLKIKTAKTQILEWSETEDKTGLLRLLTEREGEGSTTREQEKLETDEADLN